jgi:hypothetical protein
VSVLNPDGGQSPPSPLAVLALTALQPGQIEGLPAGKNKTASKALPTPVIASISPNPGPTGATASITGSNFGTCTDTSPVARFTGANNATIVATRTSCGSNTFAVQVPATAITGPVTVTAGTAVSAGFPFTVNNPRPAGVTPTSGFAGTAVVLDITGANFQPGMTVALEPSTGIQVGPVTPIDATRIQVPVTLTQNAPFGLRELVLTNADGGVGRLPNAFQVNIASSTTLTLSLTDQGGNPLNLGTWLPSVQGVQVTLGSTGACTTKTVTPTTVHLRADLSGAALPPNVTFTIVPSAIRGTAANEDCEADPVSGVALAATATPTNDFSIATLGTVPSLTLPLTVTVPVVSLGSPGGVPAGQATVQLSSWDWGGKVAITVTDSAVAPTLATTVTLPLDTDGDDLPDVYENNAVEGVDNTDASGVGVLDGSRQDRNGNGITDREDRFARDGLTNFEKYRGLYRKGPLNGTAGPMLEPLRLGAGKRNLFVRARGFGDDPVVMGQPGTCGINNAGAPVPNPMPGFPCPVFQVGDAFPSNGVRVWNVAPSFTPTSIFPIRSYVSPSRPTLDMATLTYDAVNCATNSPCDHTGKAGIRQWQFPTLGFSTFGTGTTYGDARVFLRAVKGYFVDRPYRHQEDPPGRFIPLQNSPHGRAMLAPIISVCDNVSAGADNGVVDSGECTTTVTDPDGTVITVIGGDVFVPGVFVADMTAMDVNNDGCVELPFAPDPTTLPLCDQAEASGSDGQATLQQVVRSLTTHELGHATGINLHTTDATDLMYQYTINWTRDARFSPAAAQLLQIHNKGLQ